MDLDRVRAVAVTAGGEASLSAVESVAELYEREQAGMVRLARLIVGSPALAEEVVHDAFVAVLERHETIRDPGAYLRRVVVNNCHGATRRTLTRRRKLDQIATRQPTGAVELPQDLDETWEALQVVTPKQRTALVLRFYADLSVAEVADLMGERPGTVKSLVHRGLSTLRKELSQ